MLISADQCSFWNVCEDILPGGIYQSFNIYIPRFQLIKTVLDLQLSNLIKSDYVMKFFFNRGIVWKFTTAMAPWQGSFNERLVGLVKQLLHGISRKLLY